MLSDGLLSPSLSSDAENGYLHCQSSYISRVYDLDYIRELQARYKTDPGLLERVLYAFGLLEALVKVGMKFTFKGGTSLMLLLDHPIRLSVTIYPLI